MNEKTQPELSTESMFETINQPTHTFSDVKLTTEAMTEQSSDFTMTEKNHDSSQTSGNWLESDHILTTKDLTTEEQSADKITTETVNFRKLIFKVYINLRQQLLNHRQKNQQLQKLALRTFGL